MGLLVETANLLKNKGKDIPNKNNKVFRQKQTNLVLYKEEKQQKSGNIFRCRQKTLIHYFILNNIHLFHLTSDKIICSSLQTKCVKDLRTVLAMHEQKLTYYCEHMIIYIKMFPFLDCTIRYMYPIYTICHASTIILQGNYILINFITQQTLCIPFIVATTFDTF